MNKTFRYLCSAVGASVVLMAVSVGAQGLSLNFASTTGSTIQFNGTASSFQFNASAYTGFGGIFLGTQWQIGSETGGTGSAIGLFGMVGNGPFTYGSVTTSGSDQYATVTGLLGALSINDGAGYDLTGNVDWIQVQTSSYAGGINAQLNVNIASLAYGGANPDLQSFVAGINPSMDLTFQFSPGMTLSQLTSGAGPYKTSYSGSLSVVPEPATLALAGLCGLGALVMRRRK